MENDFLRIIHNFLSEVNNGQWDTLHSYLRGASIKHLADGDPSKVWGIAATNKERKPRDSSLTGTKLIEYFRVNSDYLNKVPSRIKNALFMSLNKSYARDYGNLYLIFLRKSDRINIKYTDGDTLGNIDGVTRPFLTWNGKISPNDSKLLSMKQLPMFKVFYNIVSLNKRVDDLLEWLTKNKITLADFFKEKTYVEHIIKHTDDSIKTMVYTIPYMFVSLYKSIEKYLNRWNSIWDGNYSKHYEIIANVKEYLYIRNDTFINYLRILESGEVVLYEKYNTINEWKNNWAIDQEII